MLKTEDRLSRNVDDLDVTTGINDAVCRLAAPKVTDDMVIAIDPGDIRKQYAQKMEFLDKVYAGNEQEVGNGYHLGKVVAADIESKRVIPWYCEAYSQLAGEVLSENAQIFKALDVVNKYLGEKGIQAMDRGGDRGVIFARYLPGKQPQRLVIRLQERDLLHKGHRKNGLTMARLLPTPYTTALIGYEDGQENNRIVSYAAVPVKLPGYVHPLYLVVIKGFGVKPMMLLTSCPVNIHQKESIWKMVEYYLARWKGDASYRSIKPCYPLEDIRVRSYISIRNLVALVLAVSYFAAVY